MVRGRFWEGVRYVGVYIFVAHTYMMLFNLKINSEHYDRFVVSFLRVPNFIDHGEMSSLYKIFEFCSLLSLTSYWYPVFFLTSGIYAGLTRLYTFSDLLPIYLTKNFRPLKLSAAEFKQRTISAYPLFVELAITALVVLVVAHFVCSRLFSSDSCTSSRLPADAAARTATGPSSSRDSGAGAGKPKAELAAKQDPETTETKKSKQSKQQSKTK